MAPSAPNNKISIYPIEVTMEGEGGPYKANCLKINDTGMILEVFVSSFNPQQILILKWLLPVDNIAMQEEAIVVKKYSQNRSGQIIYLMEIHFKKIKFANASAIFNLLSRFDDAKNLSGKITGKPASDSEVPPIDKPADVTKKKN